MLRAGTSVDRNQRTQANKVRQHVYESEPKKKRGSSDVYFVLIYSPKALSIMIVCFPVRPPSVLDPRLFWGCAPRPPENDMIYSLGSNLFILFPWFPIHQTNFERAVLMRTYPFVGLATLACACGAAIDMRH